MSSFLLNCFYSQSCLLLLLSQLKKLSLRCCKLSRAALLLKEQPLNLFLLTC
ncbi:hypothetical protein D3C77_669020 [compost metagenome]